MQIARSLTIVINFMNELWLNCIIFIIIQNDHFL